MPTVLRTLSAAPTVRRDRTTNYVETLTPNGWERLSARTRRRRFPTAPTVRVVRRETEYRTAIGTNGEKSHVRFIVYGERAADYIRDSLPTVDVKTTGDDGGTLAVWYY